MWDVAIRPRTSMRRSTTTRRSSRSFVLSSRGRIGVLAMQMISPEGELYDSFRVRFHSIRNMKPIFGIFAVLIATSLSAQRLPQTIIPSHYSLYLDPVIAKKTFTGEETIDVRVGAATKEIVLN